jgi:hypothetical protein
MNNQFQTLISEMEHLKNHRDTGHQMFHKPFDL